MPLCTQRFRWSALILIGGVLCTPPINAQEQKSQQQPADKLSAPVLREPDAAIMSELRAARGETVSSEDRRNEVADQAFSLDDLLDKQQNNLTVDGEKLVQATADALFLTPELSIQSGREVHGQREAPGWLVGSKPRNLGMPAVMSVKGDTVYLVDEITNMLLTVDLKARTVWPFLDLAQNFGGTVGGIYVANDGDLYLSDRVSGRVIRYARNGQRKKVYQAPGNLKQPGSLYVNEESGHLMVLDEMFCRILIFNKFAEPVYVMGGRGEGKGHFVMPTSFYVGDNHVYVTDAVGLQVQRLNLFGEAEQVFGLNSVFNPSAVVSDSYGRVYVADATDDYIKIFVNGRLVAKYGGRGAEQGKFREIRALAVDGDRLYVAEAINRRIQVFKIAPPSN